MTNQVIDLMHLSDEEKLDLLRKMTPEQREGLRQRALIDLARLRDDPSGFACFFEFMHGSPLHSEGVKWIANAYQAHSEGRGLAQECHRESGKTTVFSKFFLAFRIGHDPNKVNAVIRINDTKAEETTAAVAQIIEHDPRWKEVFPHVVPDKSRGWGAEGYEIRRTDIEAAEWSKILTERPEGPSFVGRGWKSGSIIGSRYNGVLIVDDIHDLENTSSVRQMNMVKKWVTDTLSYCVMDGAWEIWNFTPWVENDAYAGIKSTGEYLHSKTPVMLPANEGDEGAMYWEPTPINRDYPEIGNIPHSGKWWHLYWPEVWGFDRITKKYRTAMLDEDGGGEIGFARMMMLDLEATKGITLKREWLHEYPANEISRSWPVFMGIDYASTQDKIRQKGRDYFALSILRAIPGGGLVLVDGYRGKISKGESIQTTMSYMAMYPTLQLIGVESIGKGEEFYNDLLLANDMSGKIPPLMEIKHGRRSKGDRFENWLAPRFKAARVWISDTKTPFVRAFINEWLVWPNGQNDDCIDGVYMGVLAGEGHLPVKSARSGTRERVTVNPWAGFARV